MPVLTPPFNSETKFQKISKLNKNLFCGNVLTEVLRGLVGNFEVWAPKFSAHEESTLVLKRPTAQTYSTIRRIELNARIGMPSANLFLYPDYFIRLEGGPPPTHMPNNPVLPLRVSYGVYTGPHPPF